MTQLKLDDIQALIEVFDASRWDELRVVSADFEIHLSNDPASRDRSGSGHRAAPPPVTSETTRAGTTASAGSPSAAAPVSPAPTAGGLVIPPGHIAVRAGNLGTFYQAPKPGAAPYVVIGQRVEPETELCVIEVMKLFTAVQAGVTGIVRQALVKDGELVEYDQPLFLIELAE